MTDLAGDQSSTVEYDLRSSERMRAVFITHPVARRVVRAAPGLLFLLGLAEIPLLSWPDAAFATVALWAGGLLILVTFFVDPLHRMSGRPVTLTVDRAGVHGRRLGTKIDLPWDRLTGWVEDREFIGLCNRRSTLVAIPKGSFADAAERGRFIALVEAHLPQRENPSTG